MGMEDWGVGNASAVRLRNEVGQRVRENRKSRVYEMMAATMVHFVRDKMGLGRMWFKLKRARQQSTSFIDGQTDADIPCG